MHIRDYKYTAEDVDCRYCTEFRHGRCGAIKCPWLNERIEAGVISYHDAVNESFSSRSPLLRRIRLVLTFYDKGDGKSGDEFWTKAETLLYCALIGYIHYEAPPEEQNFTTLLEFINAMEVREDDEEYKNPVDRMFEELEAREPNHFAVRQYKKRLLMKWE